MREAISAGALSMVRFRIDEANGSAPAAPDRLTRAMRALAIIDEQRLSATRHGNNVRPHRSSGLPPRVRE